MGNDRFMDKQAVQSLIEEIRRLAQRPMRFMEVCGTHTMSIFRHGIRTLLPKEIELVSGPGCPVCVTPVGQIDQMINLSLIPGVAVATFGDMLRVPGSKGSLAEARARGGQVEVVYSPVDALMLAKDQPNGTICFLGIGFETTTPSVAATILQARENRIRNFCVYSTHKLMPPALDALMAEPDLDIDGLLCPGHVSTIIGTQAYGPISEKYGLPCVVAGFEPLDILLGVYMLVRQVVDGRCQVENAYERAVSAQGNERARRVTEAVFEPVGSRWRGLGFIDASGLALREEFGELDARCRFELKEIDIPDPKGCRCSRIIKGIETPGACPLFSNVCTPLHPVGPCMVSSEGTCAAYYKYGGILEEKIR